MLLSQEQQLSQPHQDLATAIIDFYELSTRVQNLSNTGRAALTTERIAEIRLRMTSNVASANTALTAGADPQQIVFNVKAESNKMSTISAIGLLARSPHNKWRDDLIAALLEHGVDLSELYIYAVQHNDYESLNLCLRSPKFQLKPDVLQLLFTAKLSFFLSKCPSLLELKDADGHHLLLTYAFQNRNPFYGQNIWFELLLNARNQDASWLKSEKAHFTKLYAEHATEVFSVEALSTFISSRYGSIKDKSEGLAFLDWVLAENENVILRSELDSAAIQRIETKKRCHISQEKMNAVISRFIPSETVTAENRIKTQKTLLRIVEALLQENQRHGGSADDFSDPQYGVSTLLYYLVSTYQYHNSKDIITMLMNYDADSTLTAGSDKTALEKAKALGWNELIPILQVNNLVSVSHSSSIAESRYSSGSFSSSTDDTASSTSSGSGHVKKKVTIQDPQTEAVVLPSSIPTDHKNVVTLDGLPVKSALRKSSPSASSSDSSIPTSTRVLLFRAIKNQRRSFAIVSLAYAGAAVLGYFAAQVTGLGNIITMSVLAGVLGVNAIAFTAMILKGIREKVQRDRYLVNLGPLTSHVPTPTLMTSNTAPITRSHVAPNNAPPVIRETPIISIQQ